MRKTAFHRTRCVDGRLMRHDPQYDDPDLETDIGTCPKCEGEGCAWNAIVAAAVKSRERGSGR